MRTVSKTTEKKKSNEEIYNYITEADELWYTTKDLKHVSRQSHENLQDQTCFTSIKLQLAEQTLDMRKDEMDIINVFTQTHSCMHTPVQQLTCKPQKKKMKKEKSSNIE